MKRAIAMLAALIFSIGAGVEFVLPQADYFALNTKDYTYYYSITQQAAGAADIYRLQYGTDDTTSPCETENFVPHRFGSDATWESAAPYWFAVKRPSADTESVPGLAGKGGDWEKFGDIDYFWGDDHLVTESVWTYEGEDEIYICAPVSGTIQTSHYSCDYGQELDFEFTLGGSTYVMEIRHAKCWSCCRNKELDKEGSGATTDTDALGNTRYYYQANTQDSLKGRQMQAGSLLTVGVSGTTVHFVKIR